METLMNVINAMLDRAFCATLNEHLEFCVFFFGLMFAMLVFAVSALRLCVQFIIKKTRK